MKTGTALMICTWLLVVLALQINRFFGSLAGFLFLFICYLTAQYDAMYYREKQNA